MLHAFMLVFNGSFPFCLLVLSGALLLLFVLLFNGALYFLLPCSFIDWWCTMPSHPLCMLLDGILPSFACAFIFSYVHLVPPFASVVAIHNMFHVLPLFLLYCFVLWALPFHIVLLVSSSTFFVHINTFYCVALHVVVTSSKLIVCTTHAIC